MSKGINKVILVGNLGNDPETRYSPSGSAITTISVATSEKWKDKNTGQYQERTEWHSVVFFNRLAEIAAQYLKKGSKVYVEGSLRTSSYEKDGQKHYSTDIIASELQMLDGRGDSEPRQEQTTTGSQQSDYAKSGGSQPENFDSDIPF